MRGDDDMSLLGGLIGGVLGGLISRTVIHNHYHNDNVESKVSTNKSKVKVVLADTDKRLVPFDNIKDQLEHNNKYGGYNASDACRIIVQSALYNKPFNRESINEFEFMYADSGVMTNYLERLFNRSFNVKVDKEKMIVSVNDLDRSAIYEVHLITIDNTYLHKIGC